MSKIPSAITDRLVDWKTKYGEIFYLPVGEGFVLRPFTLGEFKLYTLERQVDDITAETNIVQTCLLWPENFDVEDLYQADFEIIAQKLLEVSPFDNQDRFLEKLDVARADTGRLHNAIYIHIAAAFPVMSLDMVDALYPDKLIEMLALAEKILQRPIVIDGEKQDPPSSIAPEEVQALNAQKAIAQKAARKKRVAAMRQNASGMSAPTMPSDPDQLDLMRDMRDMQRAGLGPHPDAGP